MSALEEPSVKLPEDERPQALISLDPEYNDPHQRERVFYWGEPYAIGKLNGWGVGSIREFPDTPFEISIPIQRRIEKPEAIAEVEALTPEDLKNEPFQEFYRHIDMLPRFSSPRVVASLVPAIILRAYSSDESLNFARMVDGSIDNKYESHYYEKRLSDLVDERVLVSLSVAEEVPSFKLSQKWISLFYKRAMDGHPSFIKHALELDKRNENEGERSKIKDKFVDDMTSKLLNPESQGMIDTLQLLHSSSNEKSIVSRILIQSLQQIDSDREIGELISMVADAIGVEEIRKSLREYVSEHPSFRDKFNTAFKYMGFDPTSRAAVDLRGDIYEQIEFSQYRPNKELLRREVELIDSEIIGDTVLDVGCGTGRFLEALGQKGKRVTGIDLVPAHIAHIINKGLDNEVEVASWFDIPFDDKKFDSAIFMGRSITHNTTIPDIVKCLEEIGRVIKDDGVIIVDLPDSTVGDYGEHIDKTKEIAKDRGIENILPGTINDSPDLEHYFDRYAPSAEAFKAITQLAGFVAEKLPTTQTFKGVSGRENVNTYWKLRKISQPIVMSESYIEALMRLIRK